jgi:signal transduction histidine kinase
MPRHSSRTLVLGTLALWAVAFVAWTADALVEPVENVLERALRRVPMCTAGVLLCLALGRLLDWVLGQRPRWAPLAAGAGIAVASGTFGVIHVLLIPGAGSLASAAGWLSVLDIAMLVFWVFLAWTLLYFAVRADHARRDRELRLAQAHAAARDAQHRLLLKQLNPHFLFNALNSVYALILERDEMRARRSVLALSAFLRDAVDDRAPPFVPLADELQAIRRYLDVELTRFEDRLRWVEAVPDDLLDAQVPYLILQPLVENAIKHGLDEGMRPVTIRLEVCRAEGSIVLRVADDGHGMEQGRLPDFGVGLRNVRQRLDLAYEGRARLRVGGMPGSGFVAAVELPERPE